MGLISRYGDNPDELEARLKQICVEIGEDIEGKTRAFLTVMKKD